MNYYDEKNGCKKSLDTVPFNKISIDKFNNKLQKINLISSYFFFFHLIRKNIWQMYKKHLYHPIFT